MKKITASTYKKDKYYDSIKTAVNTLLKKLKIITPIEVFIQIGNLTKENYEKGRFGKIPYLEKVITCNLSAITRKLRILKYYALEIGLKPSRTVYKRWGTRQKILLKFSKTGNELIEELYSTHYILKTAPNKNQYSKTPSTPRGKFNQKLFANPTLLNTADRSSLFNSKRFLILYIRLIFKINTG